MSNINKYIIDINNDNNEYYIHFNTIKECDNFKKIFTGKVGNICCGGLGVQLLVYNNKAVNTRDIYYIIKKKYNSN
jgi:hypothetical protein